MLNSEIGKEILDDLLDDLDDYLFWTWFDADSYYTISEGAFKDEGDDWICDICGETVVGSQACLKEEDATELIEDHIFEEHSDEMIRRAIREYLAPANPTGTQKTLGEA